MIQYDIYIYIYTANVPCYLSISLDCEKKTSRVFIIASLTLNLVNTHVEGVIHMYYLSAKAYITRMKRVRYELDKVDRNN